MRRPFPLPLMKAEKMAKKVTIFCVIANCATITEAGERRDGGSTLEVGSDISAVRAHELFSIGQVSNTPEQHEAGFDLAAALDKAAEAEHRAAAEAVQAEVGATADASTVQTDAPVE